MNSFEAIQIIESELEASEELIIEAWQHLIDTGLVWSLQGSYGQAAVKLIEQGLCEGHEVEFAA